MSVQSWIKLAGRRVSLRPQWDPSDRHPHWKDQQVLDMDVDQFAEKLMARLHSGRGDGHDQKPQSALSRARARLAKSKQG